MLLPDGSAFQEINKMKTNSKTLVGMVVAVVAGMGMTAPVQANYSGSAWYGSDPGPYSPLRAYYDYVNFSNQSGISSAESLADGLDLYDTWVATAPNYATSLYMAAYSDSTSEVYYELGELTEAYYQMTALYYYQYYAALGYTQYAYDYYSQIAYYLSYASSQPYYDLAYDVEETYGYDSDQYGNPTGLAAYYAYIFDQAGY